MSLEIATKQFYGEVAVPVPVYTTFTYKIPSELQENITVGSRVRVPFRNREIVGYLVEVHQREVSGRIKSVVEILDAKPVLTPELLVLTQKISQYYGSSWGESIENVIPKWVRFGKKAEKTLAKDAKNKLPAVPFKPKEIDYELTEEQTSAFTQILAALEQDKPRPLLIQGVTGSGKSEIYIRTIRECQKRNKSAICLVPEITLTEQLKLFFSVHFGEELEILHSKLTEKERFLAWKRIEQGEKTIILGPRSAIFAPLTNLGVIIMDEEHENSYKQETTPRYHAREVATWRAESESALFIMGSATPSLEAQRRAKKGDYSLALLKSRIDEKTLPVVQVIDLKDCMQNSKGKPVILSNKLASEIDLNIQKGEGTMLLLNRRGFSTSITCPACGHIESCKSCQVSMTHHHGKNFLLCHYCNFQKKIPEICEQCRQPTLKFAGFGTEKVESEVAKRFPQARIARLDADTIKSRGSHEVILDQFRSKKIDILIGTQMIAKGFDFPHVTLVGVILADVGLMLPDFRSSERTFQLMTQVAGRAGRRKKPGQVIIQTFSPKHPSIKYAKNHDCENFCDYESNERYQYHYPPSHQLINIIVRAKDEKKAYVFTKAIKNNLQELQELNEADYEVLGPAPCPFYKLRGHFRWHVMIKTPQNNAELTKKIMTTIQKIKKPSTVAYAVDVDPMQIL